MEGVIVLLEFVVKYWVQFVFGLLVAGGTAIIKRYKFLLKQEKERQVKETRNEIVEEVKKLVDAAMQRSDECDARISKSVEGLRRGVLSIQGRQFRAQCQELLNKSYISYREYTNLLEEWHIYHDDLGGNHEGETLFNLVTKRYGAQIENGESE